MKSTLLESVSTLRSIRILCTASGLYLIRVIKIITLKQRAREMIQAAMDVENPLGDREAHSAGEGGQSTETRTRLSDPDEGHAPNNR